MLHKVAGRLKWLKQASPVAVPAAVWQLPLSEAVRMRGHLFGPGSRQIMEAGRAV